MADRQETSTAGVAAPDAKAVVTAAQLYEGPIPHPDQLAGFERLVPGTAARLIDMALEESRHRRGQEEAALRANVAAQQKQLEIATYQGQAVFRSDLVSQLLGFIITAACVVGAVYLAINGHDAVAALLCAVPTGALIQAFFVKRKGE